MAIRANIQAAETYGLIRPLLDRLWAAIGSFPAIVLRSVLVHFVLQQAGISPPWGKPTADAVVPLLAVGCVVYGMAGSYVAMRFGSGRSIQHVLALSVLGLGLSLAGAANGKPGQAPIAVACDYRLRYQTSGCEESCFA